MEVNDNELERIWKEGVVSYMEVQSCHLSQGTARKPRRKFNRKSWYPGRDSKDSISWRLVQLTTATAVSSIHDVSGIGFAANAELWWCVRLLCVVLHEQSHIGFWFYSFVNFVKRTIGIRKFRAQTAKSNFLLRCFPVPHIHRRNFGGGGQREQMPPQYFSYLRIDFFRLLLTRRGTKKQT